MTGSITDVPGILVGNHHRIEDAELGSGWAVGTTVVLAPEGTTGGVDVRGGAPGTRETDLLDPANSVRHVDAVVLTGGSAYGLAAADGVMAWLEEHGRGVKMDGGRVPIVPAAVIFDLPVGAWGNRPTAEFGYAAVASACTDVPTGNHGAGAGARAGALKGGLGTASVKLDNGVTVGALVVVNAAGDVADKQTGLPWSADQIVRFSLKPPPDNEIEDYAAREKDPKPLNTTIAVVATDAALSPAGCRKVATAAHNGLAHTIRPAHTAVDGDTVFALATGTVPIDPDPDIPPQMSPETKLITQVGAAAADALATAVMVAVLSAESIAGIPTYRDVLPGAFA
ncbi:L-aminopeptidase/D-esterase-like protein [Mycobacterium sp. OTB74]|nr:L-aminopeptidase/D-esterase-like protein [Mycobacterium sp. OTB74]